MDLDDGESFLEGLYKETFREDFPRKIFPSGIGKLSKIVFQVLYSRRVDENIIRPMCLPRTFSWEHTG